MKKKIIAGLIALLCVVAVWGGVHFHRTNVENIKRYIDAQLRPFTPEGLTDVPPEGYIIEVDGTESIVKRSDALAEIFAVDAWETQALATVEAPVIRGTGAEGYWFAVYEDGSVEFVNLYGGFGALKQEQVCFMAPSDLAARLRVYTWSHGTPYESGGMQTTENDAA